jgi:hypothetical protein
MVTARSMKDTMPDGLFAYKSPETSRQAAKSVVPYITKIQATVLAEVRDAGGQGMTDYELEQRLGNTSATLRSRRAELVAKELIRDSGVRRRCAGSNRIVWIAVSND